MKNESYIYLWRTIMETSFYKKPNTCHLAIHLLLSAAWKNHATTIGGEKSVLQRGQITTGRERLAQETGLSPRQIRTCLDHLAKCGFLTIESTNLCSIITICNYEKYQPPRPEDRPAYRPATDQRPTSDRPLQNKGNKGNNKELSSSDDEVGLQNEVTEPQDGIDYLITKKKRKLNGKRFQSFCQFWEAFDHKVGKREAADAWYDIPTLNEALVRQIVSAAKKESSNRQKIISEGKTPKMAQGWISGRRWEDEILTTAQYKPQTIKEFDFENQIHRE